MRPIQLVKCPKCGVTHKPCLPIKGFSHPCPKNRGKHVEFKEEK